MSKLLDKVFIDALLFRDVLGEGNCDGQISNILDMSRYISSIAFNAYKRERDPGSVMVLTNRANSRLAA